MDNVSPKGQSHHLQDETHIASVVLGGMQQDNL